MSTTHQINPLTVRALMALRQVSVEVAANLAHIRVNLLVAWLNGDIDDNKVPFDKQIELLSILGVRGDHPRSDVVHHWHAHQPLFSRAKRDFWAVQALVKAFGPAQVVVISRAQDPAWTTAASARFGLRFEQFLAVLEVTAHPLRNISFGPDTVQGITWAPDTFGILLPPTEYDRMEPGSFEVRSLQQQLTYSEEMGRWETLRAQALEQGIRADHVADLLRGTAAALPALAATPTPSVAMEAVAPAASEPAAAHPVPTPEDELELLMATPVTR